jgi:hypothetical protein
MSDLLKDAVQIVCIVPKGTGRKLVEGITEEHGIFNANFSHARGVGRSVKLQNRGVGEQREKDVFSVTVDRSRSDEIFEYLFFKAGLDQPHAGFIYQQAAPQTTVMELPEVLEPS